jgi:hypothetical protein
MPLKQQTLTSSFDRRPSRRLIRVGSHNANWDTIESDDLIELLTDAAMMHSFWQSLLTLRQLSRTFRRIVNAKLDALLAALRSKADEARAGDASELESIRSPQWHPAAITYREALEQLLDYRLARSLTVNRANMADGQTRCRGRQARGHRRGIPLGQCPLHPHPVAPPRPRSLLRHGTCHTNASASIAPQASPASRAL